MQRYLCGRAHPPHLISYWVVSQYEYRLQSGPVAVAIFIKQHPSSPCSETSAPSEGIKVPEGSDTAAATQPGRALHVALAIWFLAGIKRTPTVALSTSLLSSFGVDRYAGYRGLNALERVKLVSVIRHPGRLPIVTILDNPAD